MKKEKYKKEIITFNNSCFGIVETNKPSSFNEEVNIKKYKFTIEEIKEPREILCKRIEALWIHENNFHQYQPLKKEAEKLNYKFKGEFGAKKKNNF